MEMSMMKTLLKVTARCTLSYKEANPSEDTNKGTFKLKIS